MESTKMLDGKISIHAAAGTRERKIVIFVEDTNSCTEILHIEMTPEEFGNAITGHGFRPIKFSLGDTLKVGMTHEVKTEKVTFKKLYQDGLNGVVTSSEIDRAIGEYEKDGWIGSKKDYHNHHNFVESDTGEEIYKISFHRWTERYLPEKG